MRTAATALLALLASGCATVSPECASHGGNTWRQVVSPHFSLVTNLGAEEAKASMLKLEMSRSAVLPVLQGTELSTAPIEVVLFASGAQLNAVAGTDQSFWSEDFRGPLFVIQDDANILASNPQLERTLHELTHLLSARVFRRLPRWVAEGLASYLETVTLDVKEKTARRGKANQVRLGDIERWNILPVESLWAWTGVEKDKPGLEQHRLASAWFWVYFLVNEHRAAFEGFLKALAKGDGPSAAWKKAFPELTTASMASASDKFRAEGRSTGQSIELSRMDLAITESALPDARVHAVFSRLAALRGDWKRAAEQADLASSMDANDVAVLEQVSATRGDPEARVAAAEKATLTDPRRVDAWLLLGMASASAKETALKTVLELDSSQPTAGAELAVAAKANGQNNESVDFARRAYRAPANARALAMSADVLAQAGLCREALTLELRALESLPHALEDTVAAKLHAKLDELAKCAR
ncbi:MAG: DUF1570 domain-containing protein [Archangium sp.]|nr:DUF1570 domain-containing protein [Archangium sp.]